MPSKFERSIRRPAFEYAFVINLEYGSNLLFELCLN